MARRAQLVRQDAAAAAVVGADSEAVDAQLLKQAVARINAIAAKTLELGARGLLQIGSYVLKTFYDDDPKLVSARGGNRKKQATFTALSAHPQLQMSPTYLRTAVHLAVQEHDLVGVPDIERLGASLKGVLLRVSDVKLKRNFARQALEKGLTVSQLHHRVDQKLLPPGGDGDGDSNPRPPTIPHALTSFNTIDLDALTDTKRLATMKAADRARLREALTTAQKRIRTVLRAVDSLGS